MFNSLKTSILVGAGLLALACATPADAAIRYVNAARPDDSGDGLSWATAKKTLQSALVAAGSGDEIWVAAGTYTPDQGGGQTPGSRIATFTLKNGVGIYGGFSGTETALAERDFHANLTIFSGDLSGDDVPVACSNDSPDCGDFLGDRCIDGTCIINDNIFDNSCHVVTGSGTNATAVIDGVTITAGFAFFGCNDPELVGAGLVAVSGSPTISNCVFTGNWAHQRGAGAYVSLSNSRITDCLITRNFAGNGGSGLHMFAGAPIVAQSVFSHNKGTPLYVESASGFGSNAHVTNCAFYGNVGPVGGMAIADGGSPKVVNCLFSGNTATNIGGGLAIIGSISATATVANCTFRGNTAVFNGGGLFNAAGSNTSITNSIFWGNVDDAMGLSGGPFMDESAQIHVASGTPTVTYSTVQGGWTGAGGTGNSAADPLFVNADGPDGIPGTADDDLRLSSGSPAIDAGNNAAVPADAADLDGNLNTSEPTPLDLNGKPRFVDDPLTPDSGSGTPPIVDKGAYEFQPPQPLLFVNAGASGANDGTSWEDAFQSLQDALDQAANSGGIVEEIWVAAGTYRPDQGGGQTPGDRTATFQLLNGVALYGGFAGTEAELSERDIAANPTILSGDLNGDDAPVACTNHSPDCDSFGTLCGDDGFCIIADNNAENSYHVVTGSGTDATAVLDGFTISAGNATGSNPDNAGAGMYNWEGSPTVTNCTFRGNSASAVGGGMHNDFFSSPSVTDCTFEDNRADVAGGGVFNNSGSSLIANCIFRSNASSFGAGMANEDVQPTVTGCTFIANTASDGGGGLANVNSSPALTNCAFVGNTATDGGGVWNADSSIPSVTGCLFDGNTANSGAGMHNTDSSPTITNCVFSRNTSFSHGAAMYNFDSSPSVINSLFNGNSCAVGAGGGMFNTGLGGSDPAIINCTFSGNRANNNNGGGILNTVGASPTLTNCILWANSDSTGTGPTAQVHTISGTPVVNYSIVQGGWSGAGGVGIVNADPLFVDPLGPDGIPGTEDDDLRLRPGSPAIDAGDTTALPLDTFDLDGDGNTTEWISLDLAGNPRLLDDPATVDTGVPGSAVVDMGAYEFFSDCNGNSLPDECDIACGAAQGPCDIAGCGSSDDCNGNGILDECEIAACDLGVFCDDCNLNGLLDECEIALNPLLDLDMDGIIDTCIYWTGEDGDTFWGTPGNWENDIMPNNGVVTYQVTIPQDYVCLDADIEIDALRLLDGATLDVSATGPGDLTIATAGGILVRGDRDTDAFSSLLVSGDHTISAPTGRVVIGPSARFERNTGPACDGAARPDREGSSADSAGLLSDMSSLTAGTMLVQGGTCVCPNQLSGGRVELSESMSVTVNGDLELAGSDVDICPPCAPLRLGGITPPPRLALGGDSRLVVHGNLVVRGRVDLQLGGFGQAAGRAAGLPEIELWGSFIHTGPPGAAGDIESGRFMLRAGVPVTFEAVSPDLGPSSGAFAASPFALGALDIEAGANVRLVDLVDNDSDGGGQEAIYLYQLTLGAGATLTVDRCKLYYGYLDDQGGNIVVVNSGSVEAAPLALPPLDAPAPFNVLKNRYVSFAPNNATPVAFRLVKTTAPGVIRWVGAPDVNGLAPVTAAPVVRIWSEPVVHVGDCPIVPDAAYELRASSDGGTSLSPPLVVNTIARPEPKFWGDTVGSFDGLQWSAPNGIVNTNDFIAALQKFQNLPTAPHVSVVDIQSVSSIDPCLNRITNIADVFLLIQAFQGNMYPFTTNPAACPPCP